MKCQDPRRWHGLPTAARFCRFGRPLHSAKPRPGIGFRQSSVRSGGRLAMLFVVWSGLIGGGAVRSCTGGDHATGDQRPTADEGDALWMAAQKICPVSGLALGKHGPPVKVVVGEQRQELFLCCAPCAAQPIQPQHWKAIHQNLAAAQGTCPVMQLPLRDGAAWAICRGRVVFVCCPPCIDAVADEPEVTLARVRDSYRQRLAESTEWPQP